MSLNPKFVTWAFYFLAPLGLMVKIRKWRKGEHNYPDWFKSLQTKYFICYYCFMSGLNFQGPYVYQRYLDTKMEQIQINTIMSTFNLVSSFYGFFVGYFTNLLGHKTVIVISAIFLGIHAILRSIGGYKCFIMASALMGLSTASNKVVFEDWLIQKLKENRAEDELIASLQENSQLLNLIINLAMVPISSFFCDKFGTSAIFAGSAFLFILSAFVIFFLLPKPQTPQAINNSYWSALKSIGKNIVSSRVFVLLFVVDFCHAVFLLLYNPRWLKILRSNGSKISHAKISATNSVIAMNGAQVFSFLMNYIQTDTLLFLQFFINFCCLIAMAFFFDSKNIVYCFYLMIALSDGAATSVLRILRRDYYPSDVRGYVLGFMKIPSSLAVSVYLYFSKNIETDKHLLICSILMGFGSIMSIIFCFTARKSRMLD